MMWEILGLTHLLKEWRHMPDAPPSEYSLFDIHRNRNQRFSVKEIAAQRENLMRMSPMAYYSVFPEEKPRKP
jgi:hypothetical protein